MAAPPEVGSFARVVRAWYARHARDLPWRHPGTSPWGVLVSEVMLQQTPAARVLPAWVAWMRRWPTPTDLAAASPGDAVRAWGRLGYPRRALRLHEAARAIVDLHGGVLPSDPASLRALPGIGDYTAAAISSFAFGARAAVLDTNVRRVYARVFDGVADVTGSAPTSAERADALERVPAEEPAAYSVAVMELGAVVCRARSPRCGDCPVVAECRWRAVGRPEPTRPRRVQRYVGTDRQARGRILAVLRETADPVSGAALGAAWPEPAQGRRALAALLEDGLVERVGRRYRLPA